MKALFPGSFDPVTLGHADLVRRGLECCDQVTVAVAENLSKSAIFSLDERLELLQQALPSSERLQVVTFDGLVVDYCKQHGYPVILRGLRSATDFDYECQMAQSNRQLAGEVETLFLVSDPAFSFLSSSLIKEIARNGGDLSSFLTPGVADRLRQRLSR